MVEFGMYSAAFQQRFPSPSHLPWVCGVWCVKEAADQRQGAQAAQEGRPKRSQAAAGGGSGGEESEDDGVRPHGKRRKSTCRVSWKGLGWGIACAWCMQA